MNNELSEINFRLNNQSMGFSQEYWEFTVKKSPFLKSVEVIRNKNVINNEVHRVKGDIKVLNNSNQRINTLNGRKP